MRSITTKTQISGKVERTDPRSADYPLTPLRGLVYGLLGEEKHKKPTWSYVHFRPILNRLPANETLFPQWMIGRRCWIFLFLICVKCLPSTLTFATTQCFCSWPVKNGAKMKKTGSRKSLKRKWRPFSVMIVHVGSGRLFVFFFPVKVI